MLGYAKRATTLVEWVTAEMINLANERRKIKSKWRGNPQATNMTGICTGRSKKTEEG